MAELNLDELLARTGRRNFRCGRMTVRTLLTKIAELEAQIERVRDRHRLWVLYDEDACTHEDENHDVFPIAGVGNVCADAHVKSLCRECCTDDGEFQSRHCVEDHAGTPCWPCPTKLALDSEAVASRA